jgi:hypothetical protein
MLMLGTARRTKSVSKVADPNPRGSAVWILVRMFKKNFNIFKGEVRFSTIFLEFFIYFVIKNEKK